MLGQRDADRLVAAERWSMVRESGVLLRWDALEYDGGLHSRQRYSDDHIASLDSGREGADRRGLLLGGKIGFEEVCRWLVVRGHMERRRSGLQAWLWSGWWRHLVDGLMEVMLPGTIGGLGCYGDAA
jgi:hypothetical protein